MGSTGSSDIHYAVLEIWHWVILKNNWLSATHIPSVLNVAAEKVSWQQELRTEWMLNTQDFNFAVEKLGFIPTVDLFASCIKTQLEKFMSYKPDPKCIAVDSFIQSWTGPEFILSNL